MNNDICPKCGKKLKVDSLNTYCMFCGYIVGKDDVSNEFQQEIVEKRHEQQLLEKKLGSKYQVFSQNKNIEQILLLGPFYLFLEHHYIFSFFFFFVDILLCMLAYYFIPIFHSRQFALLLTFCILRVLYSYLFNSILLHQTKKSNP